MEKISIIVPIYMVENYLSECIESIIHQTYSNLEIILVNDGSTDKCPQICEDYAKRDSRIVVINKPNGGLSDARNAGIDYATGEYLMFVDSDDYIALNMVELLYNVLKDVDADMSICNFKYVSDELDVDFKNCNLPIKDEILTGKDILLKKMFQHRGGYWVIACNKLYKRKLFENVRFAIGKIHEDEFIIHQILLQCQRVACVSEMLYFYRQRNTSIIGQAVSLKRLDAVEACFNRADAYLGIEGFEHAVLMTMLKGIVLYQTFYYQTYSKNTGHYWKRNRELQEQYRRVVKKMFQQSIYMTTIQRCRLILNYFSLYWTWKICSYRAKVLYRGQF